MKKKIANGKRGKEASAGDGQKSVEEPQGEVSVDEATIKHLQMVVSMIEGRKVTREETIELVRKVRQRSMAKEETSVYPADDPDDKPG